MSIDHTEIVRLKKRHAELTKWKRAAERYFQQYGDGGHPETTQRHRFRQRTAVAELPGVEKALLNAWEPKKKEVAY